MEKEYNVVAENENSTVVAEYEIEKRSDSTYQTEAELEKAFIKQLEGQGYEHADIHNQEELQKNLRLQLEKLNDFQFSESEWMTFFDKQLANQNEDIVAKTQKIQDDNVQILTRDDGTHKNITLIDKKNIHNNHLQVINQYVVNTEDGATHNNRYDVTILVNGFPLVHIELKRRGVPIKEAFNQIDRYQNDSFSAGVGLFKYIQIFVISNGTNTKYYSNTTRYSAVNEHSSSQSVKKGKTSNSFEFTSFWADARNRIIPDLEDFTKTFFARNTILSILTKYCILTSEDILLVMRPYQITATERILNRIAIAKNNNLYGTVKGGGYIWHTTGSGKTLTSFKTARLASELPYIDKVLFVVDRKDLDYQTMKEYDRFEKGSADSNTSTRVLSGQLSSDKSKIIITTIQKLASFIKNNAEHDVYKKHIVIIFDECHRSQFGDMHKAIVKKFKNYYLFGFTGTPIFAENAGNSTKYLTTEQTFGDQLHAYTIVDAIKDKNVLPFKVDYIKTIDKGENIDDEEVWDIEREKTMLAPERIKLVTEYILENFDRKTYRGDKSYSYNVLSNIAEVASRKKGDVQEIKNLQRIKGFNSIFAVSSVDAAKLYYREFKKQISENPNKRLRIATIFSYGINEDNGELSGILDEENPEDTSSLDQSSKEFLESAIHDYNEMFSTNYSTDGETFQNYYKDVSLRMKNKEVDLLIVVNMFLTGFDATTLNTLWVDKNLKMHGLIQAFSRTNRILNSIKTFGNIVCFRNLEKQVNSALSLFGDKDAGGIVLMKSFNDYYNGYTDKKGVYHKGYSEMIAELTKKFPLIEAEIIGEQNQKDFIMLWGSILRMRNLLSSFDEFEGNGLIEERDFQDYCGRYQDLRDEWKSKKDNDKTDITDDVVFEIELIKQIEVNIDYILMLVEKYKESHKEDKELLTTIKKAVDSSPELRSKKELIENFVSSVNETDDVISSWQEYVAEKREEELTTIIKDENLNEKETRKFIENSFREGEIKTIGTDIEKILPTMSLFKRAGAKNTVDRSKKKQGIIARLKKFLEKFSGIGGAFRAE